MALTYLGSIDDRIHEFLIEEGGINLDKLNSILIHAAIFYDKIALNDGYLLILPAAREALLYPEKSPLKGMIDSGFIEILSRQGELHRLPYDMEKTIESFHLLLDQSDWSDLEEDNKLEKWNNKLRVNGNLRRWPNKKLHIGFDLFIQYAHDSRTMPNNINEHILQNVHEEYKSLLKESEGKGPRDKWEQAAKKVCHEDDQTIRRLMEFATETYHVNFASCMSETGTVTAADTMNFSSYIHLMKHDGEAVENIKEVELPDLKIPKGLISVNDGKLLAEINIVDEVFDAKREFLDAIDKRIIGEYNDNDIDDLARNYSKELSKHLGPHMTDSTLVTLKLKAIPILVGEIPIVGVILQPAADYPVKKLIKLYQSRDRDFFPESDIFDLKHTHLNENLVKKIVDEIPPHTDEVYSDYWS